MDVACMLRLQELYFTKARSLLLMVPFGLSCKESPGVAIELRVGIALLQSQVYICHRRDGTLDLLQKQIGQLQEQTIGWKQRSAATLTKLEVETLLHHCRRALIAFSSREASSTYTYTHISLDFLRRPAQSILLYFSGVVAPCSGPRSCLSRGKPAQY